MEILAGHVIALVVTGVLVGFASGLLGIGGCFIMIPVQYWVLKSIGVDPTIAIRVAFGTNLAVVFPTAISGAYRHSIKGAVLWRAGISLGLAGLVGAFLGGYIAAHAPGSVLRIIFSLAILTGAVRMLTAKPPKVEKEPTSSIPVYLIWGFLLGIACGIIGIGGGVLMVPIMVLFLGFRIHQAVGTSTALMIFTSIGGITSYMLNGRGVNGLPPYSIGYVNLLQFILLACTSVPMAQVGAKTAHLLPAGKLRLIFILVMIYMGLKMLGLFAYLHLPI